MNGINYYKDIYRKKADLLIDNNNENEKILKSFKYYLSSSLAPTTIYDYVQVTANFLKKINKDYRNIEFDDYTYFLSGLCDTTSSYQILCYSALKKFSKYLKANEFCERDYMQYIERPKFKENIETIQKREKAFLEEEEILKFLTNIETGVGTNRAKNRQKNWKERDKAIMAIFLNTGIRCAALFKLDVSNIDFQKEVLTIIEKGGKIKEHKLNSKTIYLIKEWAAKRKELLKNVEETALFISNNKKRMSQAAIYKLVKKYGENIEGKNITPHKLRATYGTQLYNATKDIYFVQECMSHASPTTTERYIRGQKNKTEEASAIMGALINI